MQSFFDEIKHFNKIVIGGNSASGKSTLAKIMAETKGLPYYSFDKLFWRPDWKGPDPEKFKKTVTDICKQDKWIFEGGARLIEERCDAADCMIYINTPIPLCLWRALARCYRLIVLKKERDTLPQGCTPMISWFLVRYIILFPYKKKVLERMAVKVSKTKKLIILNTKDLDNIRLAYKTSKEDGEVAG
tara:strand:- start:13381 stop:13944 length:564 start_codon:yes stop_codon:yes gene_type:complete